MSATFFADGAEFRAWLEAHHDSERELRGIDADSYSIRFTPRQKRSTWSLANIRRVACCGDPPRPLVRKGRT